jgi:hypothetical protein
MGRDADNYLLIVEETIKQVLLKYSSHQKNDEDLVQLKDFMRDVIAIYTRVLFSKNVLGKNLN